MRVTKYVGINCLSYKSRRLQYNCKNSHFNYTYLCVCVSARARARVCVCVKTIEIYFYESVYIYKCFA